MEIQVSNERLANTVGTVTGADPTTEVVAAPVLGGANVTVTAATDLEKLMDELRLAQDEARQKLTLRQFAIALQRLTAQNAQLTAAQSAAIQNVTDAATALEAAKKVAESADQDVTEKEANVAVATKTLEELMSALGKQASTVSDLESELAALKATLSDQTTALDALIDALDALIEAQKKTREERAKEIRAKEQKAEDAAAEVKEDAEATQADEELQRQIDDLTAQIATAKQEVAGLEKTIAAKGAALSVATDALATQKAAVTSAQSALQTAQDEWTEARSRAALVKGVAEAAAGNLQQAIAALDAVSLAAVAASLQSVAVQVLETSDGTDEDKADEKAEAIKKLAESLTKGIAEKNDEDLEKLIAKLPDALDWYARYAGATVAGVDLSDVGIRA